MSLLAAAARRRRDILGPRPPRFRGIPYKVLTSLAGVMVPAHGFVAGTVGLSGGSGSAWRGIRGQIWEFTKTVVRGCLWAAAIAAGMLVYSTFTAKWKEKGYPTIPISALVAADQAMGARQTAIPLGGAGSATSYSPNGVRPQTTTTARQISLIDLDEYEG